MEMNATASNESMEMNATASNHSTRCTPHSHFYTVVLPCLYSILFLVALPLNGLAGWVFFKIPTTSTFVVYLKNVVSEAEGRRHHVIYS